MNDWTPQHPLGDDDWDVFDLLANLHQPWMRHGRCHDLTHLFFPERGEATREAKEVCFGGCPVREKCLEYALAAGPSLIGIWGGTTGRERRAMRRDRRVA